MNMNDGGSKLTSPGTKVGIAGTKYSMPVFSPEDDAAAALAAKALADKAAADKVAADKAAADKVIADKAAADKAIADKAEADRLAEEERKKSGMSDSEAKLLKEQMATKKKLDDANARLKLFEGLDPEAMRKLIAEQAAAALKDAEAKGDFERVKKMMGDEHTAALKKVADEKEATEKANAALNLTINNLTVGTAFTGSKFLSEETVLPASKARAIYGAYFEIEDGVVVGYDKPKGESERTKLVNAAGKPLPFETAIKRIVEADEDSDSILRSKLKGGMGSGGDPGKQRTDPSKKTELKGAALMEAILTKKAADKAKK